MARFDNTFATDLYARLAASPGNLFFSPVSIQTALAMTWAGARGATADEMAAALRFARDSDVDADIGGFLDRLNTEGSGRGYQLSVANALWGAQGYPFVPDYIKLVEKIYHGRLSDLDFAEDPEGSRRTINDWVANRTNDRIRDLLPPGVINPLVRLVLTNAIYFKGDWDLPFKKEYTKEDDFIAADGTRSKAEFMLQRTHCRYAETEDVQVLELTYGMNDLAMRVYLPRKPDGLLAFEKRMTVESSKALSEQLRREDVNIWLPKFTMERQFALADTLQAMGMKLAFDRDHADFSGMTTAEELFISAAVHKAFVKVDEQGTEAAAATGVMMQARSARITPPPKEFKADHPFFFEIVHQKTGGVLFMGRLADACQAG